MPPPKTPRRKSSSANNMGRYVPKTFYSFSENSWSILSAAASGEQKSYRLDKGKGVDKAQKLMDEFLSILQERRVARIPPAYVFCAWLDHDKNLANLDQCITTGQPIDPIQYL